MTIEFQCSFADYKESLRAHARAHMGKRGLISLIPGLLAILFGVMLLTGSSHAPTPPTTSTAQLARDSLMNLLACVYIATLFGTFVVLLSAKSRKRFVDVSRPRKRWLSPVAAAWLGGALFLLLYMLNEGMTDTPGQSRSDQILTVGFIAFIWLAAAVICYFAVFRNLLRRRWAMQQNMQRPKTMHYSPEGISINDELVDHTYRWLGFVRAIETENLFLLYPSGLTFHMVPKRAFPSIDAVDGFRRLIQEWAEGQSVGFPVIAAVAN